MSSPLSRRLRLRNARSTWGERAPLWPTIVAAVGVVCSCGGDATSSSGGSSSSGETTSTTLAESSSSGADSSTGDPGPPPPTPTLVSPGNGAELVAIDAELCWDLVEDPDGDPVRYRVYVDGIELMAGRLAEEGYEGPCLPRLFNYEQTYEWQVRAFHPAFPTSQSDVSEAWTFTTQTDGFTHTVFADPFDDDLGWEVGGEATGAWVRGDPELAMHFSEISQPANCQGGSSCYFTAHNPDGIVDAADVSGGATVLTSPEIDLSGNETATVELSRFFYKSDSETGTSLRVELLVPDDAQPDGYFHHTLEQLETTAIQGDENMWRPVEYAACGLPMVAGTRLRITATDLGDGIVEAGIDSVRVRAHNGDGLCDGGEGSVCDPNAGEAACAEGLLCCSQGAVNLGVYRCAEPEVGLDYANPPDTPNLPGNGLVGCGGPDIFVDAARLDPVLETINVSDDSCELIEMCVGGVGLRDVLRFDTYTPNIGSRDMAMGVPSNHPDLFHHSDCHNHYHFDHYASYELLDDSGVVATGHKQAFCLIDLEPWAWIGDSHEYDCGNQGISRGWADVYGSYLPCQWIDVTGVPPGTYTLRISLNNPPPGAAFPVINESNYANNVSEIEVVIPEP